MSGPDLILAVAGTIVTLMVVAGMVLLVPRNEVGVDVGDSEYDGTRQPGRNPAREGVAEPR